MATLTASKIKDLIVTTLEDLGPMKFQQIAQTLTRYEVFPRWFKKYRVVFESGYGIKRTLMTSFDRTSARHVGYTAKDKVNIGDYLTTMSVPWVHAVTSWGVIYQTDILMNRGKALILNVIKPKRAAALLGLVEELEDKAWGAAPSTTNDVDPYSIQYWLVENATTGFNGGLPGSHTTIASVNLTDHPTFKNWTALYSAVDKTDVIKTMRKCHRQIDFKSPVTIQDYRGTIGNDFRIYVNEATISSFEDVGEGQNMNLGRDLASMDGRMTFHGNPIVYVPKLDERTDNPIYMIDHSTFYPVCLKGDYLRESEPEKSSDQHNCFEVHVDLSYNFINIDRRRNGVITTAV